MADRNFQIKHKHACPLPFHHLAIRPDGGIFPCCYFRQEEVPEDLRIDHPDPFNHPFMVDLREKMRNDEAHPGCASCYRDEEISGSSMRTDISSPFINFGIPDAAEFAENSNRDYHYLTNIDLALSNVCNNRCRMCGPELSTNWYADAKKLGWGGEPRRGVVAKNSIIEDYDLSNLKFIKMIGGEPLMEQEKFISVLKKCNLPELKILIATNATTTPNEELTGLLNQCKEVNVQLSVDSYGKLNDFLRKGSSWQRVEEVVDWFLEWEKTRKATKSKTTISFHSVASIYNCNSFHELIDYSLQKGMRWTHYVMADGPDWMLPRNLPDEVKKEVAEYLNSISDNYPGYSIFKWMLNELNETGDFKHFVNTDAAVNRIRNEHWGEFNPWLWERTKPFVEVNNE